MDKEIKELTRQRDLAQARVESFLKSVGEDRLLRVDACSTSESSEVINPLCPNVGLPRSNTFKDFESLAARNKQILQIPESPEDNFLLDNSPPKFSELNPGHGWEEIAKRYDEESEDICKEVQCIEMGESMNRKAEADVLLTALKEKEGNLAMTGAMNEGAVKSTQDEYEELSDINSDNTYDALKRKIQKLHKAINQLDQSPSSEPGASSSRSLIWTRSRSRKSVLMTIPSALWSEKEEDNENLPTTASGKDFPGRAVGFEQNLPELEHDAKIEKMPEKDSQNYLNSASIEEEVIKEIDIDIDDTTSVLDFVGVNKMAKPYSENQIGDASVRNQTPLSLSMFSSRVVSQFWFPSSRVGYKLIVSII